MSSLNNHEAPRNKYSFVFFLRHRNSAHLTRCVGFALVRDKQGWEIHVVVRPEKSGQARPGQASRSGNLQDEVTSLRHFSLSVFLNERGKIYCQAQLAVFYSHFEWI